ncbi:alkaline phosphatase family protein [Mycobacterium cookii]|uniref:Alkaline phosphatase family protein n=1 Tax=Mycobacterium cookii TaxID=1775 RepID=A0A7I7KRL7_9MYCO|nr:alkaline phosphatase family protein [Mycobacterium cookii]
MADLSRDDPLRPASPLSRSSRSICDVLPAAAALLAVAGATDALGLTESLVDVRGVGVVLVDGMGFHLLPELAADAPLLASVLAGRAGRLDELACTFPSTTPTSLASLTTGVAAGQHGILGFTVKLPSTDRVLNHIFWYGDPPAAQWQPVPTWFERMQRAGIDARAVLPAKFLGSGLTEAAYRGADLHAATDGDDYARLVIDQIRATPGLVYAYTAELDTAAHVFGIGSPEWHAAAARVDALLTQLVEALPPDAALLITADHGGLNVPQDKRIDVDADRRLGAGVRVVAGDPRVRYLYTEPGAASDVIATWSELLDGRADVRSRDDAVAAGLFGSVRPEHLPRIGDVVVTCLGDTAVLATGHEPPEAARLIGFHGAATPAETAIPLIAFRG